MSDTLTDISSPIISGPREDDTSSPVQTTLGESLGATATAQWLQNPLGAGPNASAMPQATTEDLFNLGTNDQTTDLSQAPAPTVSPEDANAAAKKAGVNLTPFTAPVYKASLDAMIANQNKRQQAEDVISRSAAGIIASPARFAVGALVSLADPTNDAAMMIPGAPEAWAARAIEEAGGGILARTGVRAGVGALQGAAYGVATIPEQFTNATQEHQDFSWGDSLRQIAFDAFGGAGFGAVHGILSRAGPETTEALAKASLARVMQDHPEGVDVGAILDHGEATADQSAQDMASRAQNPTDPELVRTQRAAAQTIDTAPKLEGIDTGKDAAEASAMLADKKAEYDGLVASGELAEHPSLADEGKEHEDYGKAVDAYGKTCAFGG